MQKLSDSSLRNRAQLPTIAGSPSVALNGTNGLHTLKEAKEAPPLRSNLGMGYPKETPTKIPRISSRTSTITETSGSVLGARRSSVNASGYTVTPPSSSPPGLPANEFGVMENGDSPVKTASAVKQAAVRGSPSVPTPRVPRSAASISSTSGGILHRKSARESGIHKGSMSSVTSISTPSAANESHYRFSALSPSKGLKLLTPKISLSSTRLSNQHAHQSVASPTLGRQSVSTPSPAPSSMDEEELLGDEEMLHYIQRQQAKRMAAGATQQELDELLRFPEPLPPGIASSPAGLFSLHIVMEVERLSKLYSHPQEPLASTF